jgi:DNA repair exonuclease SbcCD nuclease subunit
MKVCLITDTHLGARNDSRNFSKYFEKFYTEVFFPYLEDNDITRIIHLGDIFDRRKYINFQTLHESRRWMFEPMRKYEVDLIIGNHDTSFKNTNDVNSPDLVLRDYPNIKVHSEATDIEIDGTCLAILPWVCSDNYLDSMEFLGKTRSQLLFGHLEIQGFEMHAGSVSDTGFDENLFKKFDMVFSGHFHHRSTRGNIHYLGSPYEMTWSDYADARGFHVFDTDTRELTFVQNPYSIFHKVFYDDSNREAVEGRIADNDFEHLANTFVKVVVKDRTDPFLFDRFVEKIEAVQPIDLTFIDNTMDMMFQEDISDDDIEDTASIISTMVTSVPKESVRKPLLALMNELHTTAVNQSSM